MYMLFYAFCSYIIDKVFKNNVTICQSEMREKHIFSSNGHIVDIKLLPSLDPEVDHFLLRYEGMYRLNQSITMFDHRGILKSQ